MPLIKSANKKAVGQNIKKEMAAGKPQKQAVAIALNTQRSSGGGSPAPSRQVSPPDASTTAPSDEAKKMVSNMRSNRWLANPPALKK